MTGAWLNLIGCLLRTIASTLSLQEFFLLKWRFEITLLGQTLAALAQPFNTYLPAKLAAVWFPNSQRVLANTLASLASPLGTATMYAMAPHIVNSNSPENFHTLASF